MRRGLLILAVWLAALGLASPPAGAGPSAAWSALKAGGHVALIRHADAPGAPGDPSGFRIGDCATQRNLGALGRREAVAIGTALRAVGVTIGKVASSPWCRCLETGALMDVGKVEIEPAFSNVFVLREQRAALNRDARALIDAWAGPGTLVVVTHGSNVEALTGVSPASGEVVVVAPSPGRALRVVGRIAPPAAP